MQNKRMSPAAMRAVVASASVILLLTLIVTVITVLSGADRVGKKPIETLPATQPAQTEDAIGTQPDQPGVEIPEQTEPSVPTVTPISWHLPVSGGVLSKGHDLKTQVYSQTMNDYRVHCGVDLQVSLGDEVKAVADGVIGNIYADPFEGTCIRLLHKDGYVSVYKNLCPELIAGLKEGDSVAGGQTIATVGESAIIEICDEAHLHLEVYLNGHAIDPMSVLPYDANEVIYSE